MVGMAGKKAKWGGGVRKQGREGEREEKVSGCGLGGVGRGLWRSLVSGGSSG